MNFLMINLKLKFLYDLIQIGFKVWKKQYFNQYEMIFGKNRIFYYLVKINIIFAQIL